MWEDQVTYVDLVEHRKKQGDILKELPKRELPKEEFEEPDQSPLTVRARPRVGRVLEGDIQEGMTAETLRRFRIASEDFTSVSREL